MTFERIVITLIHCLEHHFDMHALSRLQVRIYNLHSARNHTIYLFIRR